MRILVTGSEGTIGKPLVEALRRRTHQVWGLDLKHTADPQVIRADIADYRQLSVAIREVVPDLVYNLAAEFGRANGLAYFEQLWRSNALGMENILELQRQLEFELVHFSSSEVYGEGPFAGLSENPWRDFGLPIDSTLSEHAGWLKEDSLRMFPRVQPNSYAISKWVNECQCINAERRWGAKIVRLRLCCTYGPGEFYTPYRSVCCRFGYRLLRREPITVYANHSRVFMYVDDLIRTLGNLADQFIAGHVYNIGGTEITPITELARLTAELVGLSEAECGSLITVYPSELMTTGEKRPDCTRAVADLDHQTRTGLREGMARTLDWLHRTHGTAPPAPAPPPIPAPDPREATTAP